MTKDEILAEMKQIAEERGVDLTETAEKVAKFMAVKKIPMGCCPCHQDTPYPYRGCIGYLCEKEIDEEGVCCCHVFQRR